MGHCNHEDMAIMAIFIIPEYTNTHTETTDMKVKYELVGKKRGQQE